MSICEVARPRGDDNPPRGGGQRGSPEGTQDNLGEGQLDWPEPHIRCYVPGRADMNDLLNNRFYYTQKRIFFLCFLPK